MQKCVFNMSIQYNFMKATSPSICVAKRSCPYSGKYNIKQNETQWRKRHYSLLCTQRSQLSLFLLIHKIIILHANRLQIQNNTNKSAQYQPADIRLKWGKSNIQLHFRRLIITGTGLETGINATMMLIPRKLCSNQ